MPLVQRIGFGVLLSLWAVAALVMLSHNLAANPQVDTQLFTFSLQFLRDVGTGHATDALLEMRKYPLLPVAILAVLEAKVVALHLLVGTIAGAEEAAALVFRAPALFHLAARIFIFGGAIGTILLTYVSARKLFSDRAAGASIVFLLGSILFLTFATSVRPHVLVTAMTMLTFFLSLRSIERPARGREAAAFLSASLAFATLQSGVFAFLFPVWALLSRRRWSVRTMVRLIVLCTAGLLTALLVGYTHALGFLLGRPVEYGLALGNTDMDGQPWTGAGFAHLFNLLVWSEPLMTVVAVVGVILILKKACHPEPVEGRHAANVMVRQAHHDTFAMHPMLLAALTYVLLFGILFGLNGNAPQRFFLPIIPFLVLLGTPAIRNIRLLFMVGVVLSSIISIRFITLGLRPDTYQQAAAFLQQETSGPIASQVDDYFLGIPKTRASIGEPDTERERFIAGLPDDLSGARVFLPHERWRDASVYVAKYPWKLAEGFPAPSWTLCGEFTSADGSDVTFLWGDVPRALHRLMTADALGPWLRIYCRTGSRNQGQEAK